MALPKFSRPSWRDAFLMLASFTMVSALVWTTLVVGASRKETDFVESWQELWNRCRVSLETSAPLDTEGLVPIKAARDPRQVKVNTHTWGRPNDRFVLFDDDIAADGEHVRSCEIAVTDWYEPVSERQSAQIVLAFMRQRTDLLAKGKHEARDILVAPDMQSGFALIAPNPTGCRVAALIVASAEGGFFTSLIGEIPSDCADPSPLTIPAT